MLTRAQKRAAKMAAKTIGWLDRAMASLHDDPMTHAMNAPVGDFYEEWGRRYRRDLQRCLQNPNNPDRTRTLLLQELDRWLP